MGSGSMTRWLDVEVGTDDIHLNTLPSNVTLVDLHNDNEFKLLVGDLGRNEESPKLKIFKGAMQVSDMVLPDLPLGVVGFYTSETVPRSLPIVAVAFSSCMYLYRNMKLFYKYYLPAFELSSCELEVWKKLTDPANHNPEAIVPLTESLKAIPLKVLSLQSRNFLTMSTEHQLEYLDQPLELPARKAPEITCIATLGMNSVDRYSVSCLVVGSEDGDVIVLEPQTFTQLTQATPTVFCHGDYFDSCTALLRPKVTDVRKQSSAQENYYNDTCDGEGHREKSVCVVKRNWPEGRVLFSTDEHIISIAVAPSDNSVMVICCDNTMASYSKKGKKQWSLSLEHRPVSMTLLPVLHLGVTLTAVALASGHVHLYEAEARRDTVFVRDVASVMKFGQLGQEEHVFIIVTAGGNLMLKILKRTADFNAHAAGAGLAPGAAPGHTPWLIPKRSKLFLEQSLRERENPVAMHEAFQHELSRLRLLAARSLLEAHVKCDNSIGAGAMEPVRLAAEVEGLGPTFRVTLVVENTSSEKAVLGLSILFHVHTTSYKVSNPYIKVPLLSPGGVLKFPTKVEEIFDDNINPDVFFRSVTGSGGERALVKVLLLKEGRETPVLAATVQMPPTDPMMLPYDKIQATADFGVTNHSVQFE